MLGTERNLSDFPTYRELSAKPIKSTSAYRALGKADDKAAASYCAGGLAPLMTSHRVRATSPKKAG
jgi:hypothetical protein